MPSASQWLNTALVAMAPAQPDLRDQLLATRRDLVAVRRALLTRQATRRQPVSSYDTTRALAVVLQHSTNAALEELRAERDRLARDLASSETRRRTGPPRGVQNPPRVRGPRTGEAQPCNMYATAAPERRPSCATWQSQRCPGAATKKTRCSL